MLYLVLLWWMVVGNFTRALVHFGQERIVTEGVITMNALVCTLMAILWARRSVQPATEPMAHTGVTGEEVSGRIRRSALAALATLAVSLLVCWGAVRALYGDTFAGYAGHHIRFGPHQTSNRR
jgi:hypothetical protein